MSMSELIGDQLDREVAKCEGYSVNLSKTGFLIFSDPLIQCGPRGSVYSPSNNWLQGGHIIEREKISLISDYHEIEEGWLAESYNGKVQVFGPTPLVAAMRCYVASKTNAD